MVGVDDGALYEDETLADDISVGLEIEGFTDALEMGPIDEKDATLETRLDAALDTELEMALDGALETALDAALDAEETETDGDAEGAVELEADAMLDGRALLLRRQRLAEATVARMTKKGSDSRMMAR